MNELILVVEDETDIQHVLDFNLRSAGFRTAVAGNGLAALELAHKETPDLVLLDLMLPDLSGVEVCRRLRREPATREIPVIMLTARNEEIDRVVGFEVGADDYVPKPFSVRELLLRLRAVLRRAQGATEVASVNEPLRHGPVAMDLAGRRVFVGPGEAAEEIQLTVIEFELLRTLIERRGRVQSRERLLTDVWQVSPDIESRTVDTHVKRLRQKLGIAGNMIETVRGVGYRLGGDDAETGAAASDRSGPNRAGQDENEGRDESEGRGDREGRDESENRGGDREGRDDHQGRYGAEAAQVRSGAAKETSV
jgi:two-component system phosphate regulon response regulator PhoB